MISGMISSEQFERMGLPKEFWTARLADIPEPQKSAVAKFMVNRHFLSDGVGLLLTGGLGLGKSCAAAVALQSVALRVLRGLFVRADDVAGYIINQTHFDDAESYEARMERVDLLVLDELKLKKEDSFRDSAIERIVRRRLENNKSLIITTNLTPKQIQDAFPPLADLIRAFLYTVSFTGVSMRKAMATNLKQVFEGTHGRTR